MRTALPWRNAETARRTCCRPQCEPMQRRASTQWRRNNASPIIPGGPPTDPSIPVDDVKKTVTTAIGDLPLSPIMDPSYWTSVLRHQAPKMPKSKPQNSVERQFRRNTYALALSTPIRQCTASKIRLPSFFLQDFNIVAHPESHQPWWVPGTESWDREPWEDEAEEQPAESKQTLVTDDEFNEKITAPPIEEPPSEEPLSEEPPSEDLPEADKKTETYWWMKGRLEDIPDEETLDEDISSEETPGAEKKAVTDWWTRARAAETPDKETPANVPLKNAKAYGPAAYTLARQDLISSFTTKGSGYEHYHKRLFGGSSSKFTHFAGKAVWRKDTDSFILDQMRQGIVKDLIYLSKLCTQEKRRYIVMCNSWEDDTQHFNPGALLWFENPLGPDGSPSTGAQPEPFVFQQIVNDKATIGLVIYNIPALLGAENVEIIRKNAEMFTNGPLFLLVRRRTASVQLKLWRLQGYLAA